MRNLAELNINDGGKPITRPAPTDEEIGEFETSFGLKLPEEYLTLSRFSNGGHPEVDSFRALGRSDFSGWAVNRFYFLNREKGAYGNLWKGTLEWRRILGPNALPFADNGMGDPFVLDLSTTPASVKVCIHEDQFVLVTLAPSLEAFLDGLTLDPDMI